MGPEGTFSKARSRIRFLALFGLALTIVLGAAPGPRFVDAEAQTAGGSSGPNDVASIDKELEEVLAELDRLGVEEEIATEEYLRAEDELGKARAEEASATVAVEEARRHLDMARTALARRMAAAYKRGGDLTFRMSRVLEAKSFAEAGAVSKVISLVLQEDQKALVSWRETEALRAEAEAEYARATETRAQKALEASRRLEAIQSTIRQKEAYRSSLEGRKRELLEAYEREQRRREEAAASAYLGSGGTRFRVTGASSERVARAVEIALAQLGKPYRYGAAGPDSFDCSGLVLYAFSQAGFGGIPHRADLQYFLTDNHPARNELRPGDLVFFSRPGNAEGIHHNGIYVGDGMMVHAPQTGDVVKLSSIGRSDYFGATRLA